MLLPVAAHISDSTFRYQQKSLAAFNSGQSLGKKKAFQLIKKAKFLMFPSKVIFAD